MKPRSSGRVVVKDRADRENDILFGMGDFEGAVGDEKVMHKQSLGGQITRHDGPEEAGKPARPRPSKDERASKDEKAADVAVDGREMDVAVRGGREAKEEVEEESDDDEDEEVLEKEA